MARSKWMIAPCTLLAVGVLCPAEPPPPPKDFTKATLKSLGVTSVTPEKDGKTGFVVGGKNATPLILGLKEVAGLPIRRLEESMRPGALSGKGFLGKDERLLDVMAGDNRYVVEKRGLTHQEVARHLHLLGAVAVKHGAAKPVEIAYHGKKFRVSARCYKGFQESPFRDGTRTNCDVTVANVASGKELSYSLLVPFMIERYGFYEGEGTPYRVDPGKVLEVFDFLKPAKAE